MREGAQNQVEHLDRHVQEARKVRALHHQGAAAVDPVVHARPQHSQRIRADLAPPVALLEGEDRPAGFFPDPGWPCKDT